METLALGLIIFSLSGFCLYFALLCMIALRKRP